MVYKSPLYTDFIGDQLKRFSKITSDNVKVSFRIVGNDPTPAVVKSLEKWPSSIHKNKDKSEFYINRQYKGFNYCVTSSKADHVCLVNSDMAFHDGWLDALWYLYDEDTIPASRLVNREERMEANELVQDFGTPHDHFDGAAWEEFAIANRRPGFAGGGMFMPIIFKKSRFVEAGCYPEGNIGANGEIAKEEDFSDVVMSGDKWLFQQMNEVYGMKHITALDSLTYHVREGEKHLK